MSVEAEPRSGRRTWRAVLVGVWDGSGNLMAAEESVSAGGRWLRERGRGGRAGDGEESVEGGSAVVVVAGGDEDEEEERRG